MNADATLTLPFPIGTLTNYGTLLYYDEEGFAFFVNEKKQHSWVGPKAFKFVQVRK